MNTIRKAVWILTAVILGGFLIGCGRTTFRLGWLESNRPGRFSASYVTFTGSESRWLQVDAGDRLVLTYDVEVAKGRLALKIEAPDDRILWWRSFSDDAQGSAELALEQGGRHSIVSDGDRTGGSFRLSWALQ